jgi:hypothetical protein
MIDSLFFHAKQTRHIINLLFSKFSLVKSLSLDNNHKKKCTLGGTTNFHRAGTYTRVTPLNLITLYSDSDEYTPDDWNCQIISPSSSEKAIVEAKLTTSSYKLNNI